ncbi:hypothetical protein D3C81_2011920 [compost metagenome]
MFDMLILGYAPEGLVYRGLYHADPGTAVGIPPIVTNYRSFEVHVITNINSFSGTGITMRAWNNGALAAVYTQEDAIRAN